MSLNKQLTSNFNLREFVTGNAMPNDATLENIDRLAQRLQVLRDIVGKPIRINDGYRTWAQHEAIYKKYYPGQTPPKNSKHLSGEGADIPKSDIPTWLQVLLQQGWSGGRARMPHTFTWI